MQAARPRPGRLPQLRACSFALDHNLFFLTEPLRIYIRSTYLFSIHDRHDL
jgi:hypothetical protein